MTAVAAPAPALSFPGVTAAGPGLDLSFAGTRPAGPLTLMFDAGQAPPGAVPVVVHVGDDGTVNVLPATRNNAGQIVVATEDFSLNVPAWLDPPAWLHAFGDRLASALGGRTSQLICPGGPSWFTYNDSTDLVHVCSKPATYASHPDAELDIKSNRGVTMLVDVAGSPDYTWVEGQNDTKRQDLASTLGYDWRHWVLLPAGATTTAGYARQAAAGITTLNVGDWRAIADTLSATLLDAVGSLDPTVVGYMTLKCAAGLKAGLTSGVRVSASSMLDFLKCVTGTVEGALSDTTTATRLAARWGGNAASIIDHAKSLKFLGAIVTAWPFLQAGWGGVADQIENLITGGTNNQVPFQASGVTAPRKDLGPKMITVQPVVAGTLDPAHGYTVTDEVVPLTSCMTSALAGFVFGCGFADGTHNDACWQGTTGASPTVVCLPFPWSNHAYRSSLGAGHVPAHTRSTGAAPWGLQLSTGVRCALVTGLEAEALSAPYRYLCTGRAQQQQATAPVQSSNGEWTVQTATVQLPSGALKMDAYRIRVVVVWQVGDPYQ